MSNELQTRQDGFDIATSSQQFDALIRFGDQLVKTQFLPSAIKTGAQAAAVILTGRELGLQPMKALRLISIVNGKPTLAAELQLGMFVNRGGRVKWLESTNTKAVLHLTAPNGDEHTETFTIEDAKLAGLTGKQVWTQYPKMMLRARCSTGALRAIDPSNSLYDPEEIGGQPVTPDGEPLKVEVEVVDEAPTVPTTQPVKTEAEIKAENERNENLRNWIKEAKTLNDLAAVWKTIAAQHKELPAELMNELTKLKDARKALLQTAPKVEVTVEEPVENALFEEVLSFKEMGEFVTSVYKITTLDQIEAHGKWLDEHASEFNEATVKLGRKRLEEQKAKVNG